MSDQDRISPYNIVEVVDLKELVFLVGVSRMAGCVYRLLRRQTSTSKQRIWAVLSPKWKLKWFAVGVSNLRPRKFGNFTLLIGIANHDGDGNEETKKQKILLEQQ